MSDFRRSEPDDDHSTLHCPCGATFTWSGYDPRLLAWEAEHHSHLEQRPSEGPTGFSEVRCTLCGAARIRRPDGTPGACSLIGCKDPLHDARTEKRTNDATRGLYKKYHVTRTSDPEGKHDQCEYFVLDLVHDAHAKAALLAYAASCEAEYPQLAADLRAKFPTAQRTQEAPTAETEALKTLYALALAGNYMSIAKLNDLHAKVRDALLAAPRPDKPQCTHTGNISAMDLGDYGPAYWCEECGALDDSGELEHQWRTPKRPS